MLMQVELGHELLLTLFQVLDIAARQSNANFVDFRRRNSTSCIVFFLALSDVTHSE